MTATMTPLQRFEMAASMGVPDQVPLMPFITGHFFSWFNNLEEGDYWPYPEAKLKAQIAVQERWPDLMLFPGIFIDYSTVVEPSALGGEAKYPRNASPQIEPFLKDIDAVFALEPADPYTDGLMPAALDTLRYMLDHCPKKWIDEYRYLAGAGAALGPTDVACLCRGYDTFAMDLYRNPDAAHHLMEVATETLIRYYHAQEEIGGKFHRFLVADDAIGFVSQRHFVEFCLPYLQRIFQEFSYAVGIFHCDAKTTHLLDVIADVGMQVFNFDAHMDIAWVKEKIGDRVCLLGNIAPLTILREGTPEEVKAECKRIVELAKHDGGFILSMGSGTARGTPSENIDAMQAAVAEYGK
jgi:uroporphyrinogen decarboxylase